MKNFSGSGKLTLREWWPNLLYLKMLHQNTPELNPYGRHFDYAQEFAKLDLDQIKEDLKSDDRMWALAASRLWALSRTYRVLDRRCSAKGGLIRFAS